MDFSQFREQPPSELLKKYTVDLTQKALENKIDPVIGRDEEIRRCIRILSRKLKNNPLLVGEPGVGKTAIVEGLAKRIVEKDIPDNFLNKKILMLDVISLLAGASFQGEFEKRLKGVIEAISSSNGEIILFIDEAHLIVGAGKTQGAVDASNILKPALARGDLRCIGATTFNEYREYIEKDSALERRFQKVVVKEPSVVETMQILRGLKDRFQSYHGVRIQDNAINSAVKLSDRYLTNRFLPDKAVDLIDEACADIKTELSSTPSIIDEIQRKKVNLQVEKASLESEAKENQNSFRINQINKELEEVQEQERLIKTK